MKGVIGTGWGRVVMADVTDCGLAADLAAVGVGVGGFIGFILCGGIGSRGVGGFGSGGGRGTAGVGDDGGVVGDVDLDLWIADGAVGEGDVETVLGEFSGTDPLDEGLADGFGALKSGGLGVILAGLGGKDAEDADVGEGGSREGGDEGLG